MPAPRCLLGGFHGCRFDAAGGHTGRGTVTVAVTIAIRITTIIIIDIVDINDIMLIIIVIIIITIIIDIIVIIIIIIIIIKSCTGSGYTSAAAAAPGAEVSAWDKQMPAKAPIIPIS